jgi:hypothetical protein
MPATIIMIIETAGECITAFTFFFCCVSFTWFGTEVTFSEHRLNSFPSTSFVEGMGTKCYSRGKKRVHVSVLVLLKTVERGIEARR